MPGFTRAFGGAALAHGTAHCTTDGAGAALWLAPGIAPDEAELLATVETTVAPAVRNEVLAMVEAMGHHHPDQPHWYLPMIGVEPSRQGRGHGAALLRHQLARCDDEGTLAYLESSNPRNISLYLRHGFEITGEIQAGSSPVMVPMVRTPR
jgi:ribosomal protein S18 acetylase RimI-like enzyme